MTRFTKNLFTAAVVLTVLAVPACSGASRSKGVSHSGAHTPRAATNAAPATNGSTPGNATWMSDVAPDIQNRKLTDFVIPGSHDSASYYYSYGDLDSVSSPFAITQTNDLPTQLNDGMRELDVRVQCQSNGVCWAHHGTIVSDRVNLSDIFRDIGTWAKAAGHQQEIIMLNLSIDSVSPDGSNFPNYDCSSFGQQLGNALVTPDVVQAHFHTADPGQLTPGQLWSLPDSTGAARVIMDNSQCMEAAHPHAGAWSGFSPGQSLYSGYYADQCEADPYGFLGEFPGIKQQVLAAAQQRATDGSGTSPVPLGPAKRGGVYVLGIQGTPENDRDNLCWHTPLILQPQEKEVLDALDAQWQNDQATKANLNIVSADFVETTDLMKDVLAMDEHLPTPVSPDSISRLDPYDDIAITGGSFASCCGVRVSYPPGYPAPYKVTYKITPADGTTGDGPSWNGSDTLTTELTDPLHDEMWLGADEPAISAGPKAGTWTLTASVPGVSAQVTWRLTVSATTLYLIQVPGSPTSVPAGGTTSGGFKIAVADTGDQPMPGMSVTFDATSVGGTFAGSGTAKSTVTVKTGPDGIAESPPFTAGSRAVQSYIKVSSPGAYPPEVDLSVTVTAS